MKIFVTGATGYVGSRVVDQLVAEGHKVVGLCRNEEKAKILRSKGVEPLIGDVREVAPIEKAAREADAVIHIAFVGTFDNCKPEDRELMSAFHRALKGTHKPFILTTATLIFGETEPGKPVDDSVSPSSIPKDRPRAILDAHCLELAKDGLNISIVRLATFVYGYNGSGFIPAAISSAKKYGYAAYIGDGSGKFASVHVDDAARAYLAVLAKGKPGQAYHVVSDNETTFKEVAEAVGKLVGVPVKSITKEEAYEYYELPFFTVAFSVNHQATGSRLASDCGWKPTSKTTILQDIENGSYTPDCAFKK
eukprot:Phypoly_transcript_03343.p1 GENE.Phypoly_transcript_03343~~Phypoly_transcript_03343.p1  ORF type:complete len:307 (+),score=45.39 Phypoly_transcript_03343:1423-2343(+)